LEEYERAIPAGFGLISGGLGYQSARKERVTNSWFYCNEKTPELLDKRYLPQYYALLEELVQSFKKTCVRHVDRFFLANPTRPASNANLLPTTIHPILSAPPDPHRPFSAVEVKKRERLVAYLDQVSEDQLIETIPLPLFRELGFQRITAAGHRDKALEFGKDIWMKFALPTRHFLYFGIQVKKDKLDSAGVSRRGNANVAEFHNQVTMTLGSEIFDPEIGRRVLIDHAFIIASGEITKAARLWVGSQFDNSKRSQLMFMDREDIVNLYVVTNLPVPDVGAIRSEAAAEGDSQAGLEGPG
jgi:hypothetical protein